MRTLDVLLGTEVNEIFFPWAAVNTGELSEYWLVEIRTQRVRQPLGWIDGRLDDLGRIEDSRNPYPAELSPALGAVCLYPWEELESGDVISADIDELNTRGLWSAVGIGPMLVTHDDLLDSPTRTPDLRRLHREPVFDYDGQEVGEQPVVYFPPGANGTNRFRVALGSLLKAYDSFGLDQLLWHVTSLEALLGSKGSRITERLVKRLGAILGDTDAARKATENHLRKIYAIRSALVHGGRFREDLHVGYLTLARAFACSAAAWFLSCHRAIREAQPAQLHLTSADFRLRDDILTLLDMDDEERRRMARLLAGLPEAFPRVPLLLSATEPGSFFD